MSATQEEADRFSLITPEQWAFYQKEGYLHLKQVVPEDILTLIQRPLERWVESTIQQWKSDGRLESTLSDLPFTQRLNDAWFAAGKPQYERSPRRNIVGPEVFDFMRHEVFLKLAHDLIDSPNIAAHGIFNARPKLQQQQFTNTPWHQDAQYFRESAGSNIITVWVPLVDVSEENSCLQVAPGRHRDPLYDNYLDPETKFTGLTPADRATLKGKPIPMQRGDLLCFNQLMPHAALPNKTKSVRWSMDIRFEDVDAPYSSALDKGFVCAHEDPTKITPSFESWYDSAWKNAENAY